VLTIPLSFHIAHENRETQIPSVISKDLLLGVWWYGLLAWLSREGLCIQGYADDLALLINENFPGAVSEQSSCKGL
jgi:hypothetical protein